MDCKTKYCDALLQLMADFKTPLDRGHENIDAFLERTYREYLTALHAACDDTKNPKVGNGMVYLVNDKINEIQYLCDSILKTIRLFKREPDEARNIMRNGLEAIRDDLPTLSLGWFRQDMYYRIRTIDTKRSMERKELFHAPFEAQMENQKSACRYSIKEFPCLYLASQLPIAWYECGKPDCFAVAAFSVPQDKNNALRALDFGQDMFSLASEFSAEFVNSKDDESRMRKLQQLLLQHLVAYPLRAACSVMVKQEKSEAEVIPEYIIPQMLMQWIQEKGDFDGVSYESSKYDGDDTELRSMGGHNLALVTKSFDVDGYSVELKKILKLSAPISVDLKHDYNGNDANSWKWTLEGNIAKDFQRI